MDESQRGSEDVWGDDLIPTAATMSEEE